MGQRKRKRDQNTMNYEWWTARLGINVVARVSSQRGYVQTVTINAIAIC